MQLHQKSQTVVPAQSSFKSTIPFHPLHLNRFKCIKQSVTDLAGTIDTVNSDLVSMLDKVNDNIAEYQKILDSFNSSVGGTQTLIITQKVPHLL